MSTPPGSKSSSRRTTSPPIEGEDPLNLNLSDDAPLTAAMAHSLFLRMKDEIQSDLEDRLTDMHRRAVGDSTEKIDWRLDQIQSSLHSSLDVIKQDMVKHMTSLFEGFVSKFADPGSRHSKDCILNK